MGLAIGIGNGILFTSQRGVSSIIPGLIDDLCARATYCENKLCTTATLEEIEAVRYTPPPPPPPPGLLLEDYPGAAAAYSLRNLIDTTTNVVRVRRSSDNTEQDFSAAEITDGTLTTFTGANDGFVTTWYDQSGNGVDGVQATAIQQPKIVSAGSLIVENSLPTLDFATNKYMRAITGVNAQPNTFIHVIRLNNNNNKNITDSYTGGRNGLFTTATGVYSLYAGSFRPGVSANTSSIELIFSLFNNTSSYIAKNSSASPIGNSGTQSSDSLSIGGVISGNFDGVMSELIFYNLDQSANRTAIETNINNYYSIY